MLKEFHGVYLFANDGKLNFNPGVLLSVAQHLQSTAEDYDQDIAAISFFPDYQRSPAESFVYPDNQGDLKFTATSFPEATRGRWIVMDSGDLDKDGETDIALGSFVGFPTEGDTTGLYRRWLQSSPSVVVLENTTR